MWISDLSIRRPIVAIVAMLVLVLAGGLALAALETDEFPDVQLPVVSVTVPYPGAGPAQVEREVLRPIEQKLRALGGIKKVSGSALDGVAVLAAEFVFEKRAADAMQDVRDAVGAIRGSLPSEVKEPLIERYSETDLPLQSLVLASSNESPLALGERARRLARELRTLAGVAQVSVLGAVRPELAVEPRPEALRAAGVTLAELLATLEAGNVSVPVGKLQDGRRDDALRFLGRPAAPADFAALAMRTGGSQLVRVGDVATVQVREAERDGAAFLDGRRSVSLDVRKVRGASATAVAERVRAAVADARRTLPAGTTLTIVQDAGVRTARSVWDVEKTLLEGAVLTVLVVFLFLNSWRSTVITGLALPVSVLASFVAVWALGFKLDTMSLLGLSLAIGLLIDDAIVVRENIVRHVAMGKDHLTAAREGTAEIGLAVAATTLAIVVVFVPVGFMGGVAGQWFKPFALTIASSVLVSLFVSFSLDPMLSAWWPDPVLPPERRPAITRLLDRFNVAVDALAHRYRAVIAWALDHRAATLGVAAAALVASAVLPASGLVGSEFLAADDQSELRILVEAPPGSSLDYTSRKAEEIAGLARRRPEVRSTYVVVGSQTGRLTDATVLVLLRPRAERARSARDLLAVLRQDARQLTGATYSMLESGAGSAGTKPLALEVRGPDVAALGAVAREIASRVRAVPGAVDVTLSARGGQPQLDIALQRSLASTLGLSAQEVATTLRAAFAGVEAGDWTDGAGETRKVVVRFPADARRTVADLDRLPLLVADATGVLAPVPLQQVARVAAAEGPAQVDHIDGEAVVTVQANVEARPLGAVAADIDAAVAAVPLPAGVRIVQGGDVEQQREVFSRMLVALAAALLAMYFVLVLQFNSWVEPLAILASLPLAMIGVMAGLAVTGQTLNLMSLIGVVLLAGVVAKNAILLLEFAKQLQEEHGMGRHAALVEAGAVRLRPILMTTLALVVGMLPVAIGHGEGGQFRAPLGIAVIGGTVASTLLTLLVIPTVYDMLLSLLPRRRAAAASVAGPAPEAAHG